MLSSLPECSLPALVSNNDGDVNATLIVSRGPRVAYYAGGEFRAFIHRGVPQDE